MPLVLTLPTPLQVFDYPPWRPYGVSVAVKRDDLIHPALSGNKWRKLKYNLEAARTRGLTRMLSFGGAWSNHLHALAWAGQRLGFATVGLVRGEPGAGLTPTLADCRAWGMELHFLSRADYRRRRDPEWLAGLETRFAPCWLLPEGGSNALAVRGVAELVAELDRPFDVIACATGSGATLAGLAAGCPDGARALGIAVLKQGEYLRGEVGRLLSDAGIPDRNNWRLLTGLHGGGYAKAGPELLRFCGEVEATTGVALEPVYTGKLFHGIGQLLAAGEFSPGTRLVLYHSGGLQGRRGFQVLQ